MSKINKTIKQFVDEKNKAKKLFTAGPASLLYENLLGIRPCFGRGDKDYIEVEEKVLNLLKKMSGHSKIVRMQGSGSLAIEIMTLNFLFGRILVVSTGYYSDRVKLMCETAKRKINAIKSIEYCDWKQLDNIKGNYDWLVSCSTETSSGIKIPIQNLSNLAKKINAKLMLDATASMGLEIDHHLADVISYSSCKGLFGLTGACFISYNNDPSNQVDSFYLSVKSRVLALVALSCTEDIP